MKTSQEILTEVKSILRTDWKARDGRQVPAPEDIKLGNDAVKIEGAVLYADIAESTSLVDGYKDWFAAEVYKCYLVAACHAIRNNAGTITSFDGDRVMAVFIGGSKCSSAAKTALQINFLVKEINAEIKKRYTNTAFDLKQAVGIDVSPLYVARTGIRNSNDLVWVGKAANYAAKLCNLREGDFATYVTEAIFNVLSEETKFGGNPKKSMWDKRVWSEKGVPVYRSSWLWKW